MQIRKNAKLENANLGKCKIEIWINGNLEKWKHEKMEKGKIEIKKMEIWKIGNLKNYVR